MQMPTDAMGRLIFPGCWIKVWTPLFGGIWHHGIVSSISKRADGTWLVMVIHNTKGAGVSTTPLQDFADGRQVILHRQPRSDEHTGWILASAAVNIGKPYDWFSQNCEHFCSFCYTWRPKSETLEGLGTVAAIFSAVMIGAAFWKD